MPGALGGCAGLWTCFVSWLTTLPSMKSCCSPGSSTHTRLPAASMWRDREGGGGEGGREGEREGGREGEGGRKEAGREKGGREGRARGVEGGKG